VLGLLARQARLARQAVRLRGQHIRVCEKVRAFQSRWGSLG